MANNNKILKFEMNHFEIADPMRSMKGYLQVVGMNIHLRAINS